MYGHQWLWDSALTSIGLSHLNPQRAALEISSLFEGQWNNGMVPNMIFTKGRLFGDPPFKPDYLVWSSKLLNKNAPRTVATSGITQPPIIAEAAWRIGEKLDHDDRQAFWTDTVGHLATYHSWIYKERNLKGDGLFSAVHPWETGMENTPTWMQHMRSIDWGKVAGMRHTLDRAMQGIRPDTKEVDAEERASTDEGLLYIDALLRLVSTRYDRHKIADTYPLHIQDVHMNSILIRNNEILQELAQEVSIALPDILQENMASTRKNIETLWDEKDAMYYPRDAVTGYPIKVATIASLMPLYSGAILPERAEALMGHARDPASFGLRHGIPTVPKNSPFYRERRFWSGPSWVNMNWLLSDGQRRMGYSDESKTLASKTLDTIAIGGMKEYFSAKTAEGLGAKNFSWTAALAIDLIREQKK
jgi:neutral trehalase